MAAPALPRWAARLLANYPLWILVGIYILSCLLVPNFLSEANQLNLIRQSSVIGIVSLAMLVVIISAGIDLSVGSLAALAGVIAVGTQVQLPLPLAVFAGIAVGVALGAFNGAVIAFMRVPPFVMTLGMLALAAGRLHRHRNPQCRRQRHLWRGQ